MNVKKILAGVIGSLIFLASIPLSEMGIGIEFIRSTVVSGIADSGSCGNSATYTISGKMLRISGSGEIAESAFEGLTSVDVVDIGDGITSICKCAFKGCTGLERVMLPDNVTSIGESVFDGCTSLSDVFIPSKVTTIGKNAFRGCSNVAVIDFGSEITSIEEGTCDGCTSLRSVFIPSKVTTIGKNAFRGCSSATSIDFRSNTISIGEGACDGCTSLKRISIPSKVTTIGKNAFKGCSNATSIDFGSNITSIEEGTCDGCTSLRDISIPYKVTTIGNNAFRGCSNATSIDFGLEITSIGEGACDGCTSLRDISIPYKVTTIGNNAFRGCSGLTKILIPDKVTSIGADAFDNCNSLGIYGYAGSYAATYALENSKQFYVSAVISLKNCTSDAITFDRTEYIAYNNGYKLTITANDGFILPESVNVLTSSFNDYTYNNTTGEILITANTFKGRLFVDAEAVEAPPAPELTPEPEQPVNAGTELTRGNFEVEIANEVNNPIIKVVVPTTFEFAIDAFEQRDKGTQIYSSENYIINKSNVSVKADVSMNVITLNNDDSISFSLTKDGVAESTANNTGAKSIWLAAIASEKIESVKTKKTVPSIGMYAYFKLNTADETGACWKEINNKAINKESGKIVYSSYDYIDSMAESIKKASSTDPNHIAGVKNVYGYSDNGTYYTEVFTSGKIKYYSTVKKASATSQISGGTITPDLDNGINGYLTASTDKIYRYAKVNDSGVYVSDSEYREGTHTYVYSTYPKISASAGAIQYYAEGIAGTEYEYNDVINAKGKYTFTADEKAENVFTLSNAVSTDEKTAMTFALGKAQNIDVVCSENARILVPTSVNNDPNNKLGSAELSQADDNNTNQGIASFRFIGKVNENVVWKSSEARISVTYTLSGMSDRVYADVMTKTVDGNVVLANGTHQLINKKIEEPVSKLTT